MARWRSTETGKAQGKPIFTTEDISLGNQLAANGNRLVGYRNGAIFSRDISNPTARPTTLRSRKHFTGLAVHPDGRRVFATCNDETVREYDAVTQQELQAYARKVGKLTCVAVAPDGLTAAAGSDTGKVVVWDLA